jgi:transketolase
MARVNPAEPYDDDRDRIIVSHGHTSPGAYSSLAAAGFFSIKPALHGFRQAGSPFEGHVEQSVPGIEWDTGNLGQGLSVGLGKAIYARLSNKSFHTYVVMGDGEQQKGQIAEARRAARKFGLGGMTAIIDYNRLQISGKLPDVMPQQIKEGWESDGWKVIEIDAHDLNAIYEALHQATQDRDNNFMILAHSTMGKGVSFMENDEGFHGAPVPMDKIGQALEEVSAENDIDQLLEKRKQGPPPQFSPKPQTYPTVQPGTPIIYAPDASIDNRSAWGKALVSLAEANQSPNGPKIAVFDCDLAGSVRTHWFGDKYPDTFFQFGVAEHNAATAAGALSTENVVSIWADFGVFGISETYNQARLNDINHSNLKLFCTHSGVNVGEDGKTHQCIDYFALLNSTFGWKVITPADPNQTDRVARHVLTQPGNFAVIMGRTKCPIITDESGQPFFGERYTYRYGRMETVRSGEGLAVVSSGNMLPYAMEAWQALEAEGRRVALVSVSDWCDLHEDDLRTLATYNDVVVYEDHNVKTGLGTAIGAALIESGLNTRLTKVGVTAYASSGKPVNLYKQLGMDAASLVARVRTLLDKARVRV